MGKVEKGNFTVGTTVKADDDFAQAQKAYLRQMEEDEHDQEAFLMAEYNDECELAPGPAHLIPSALPHP